MLSSNPAAEINKIMHEWWNGIHIAFKRRRRFIPVESSNLSSCTYGQVAKLENAPVLGTGSSDCGFNSHLGYYGIMVELVDTVVSKATKTKIFVGVRVPLISLI